MSSINDIRERGIANRHDACFLELAARLEKLEATSKQPPAAESPPQPFRVTGPGKYQTADDSLVNLKYRRSASGGCPWVGEHHDPLIGIVERTWSDTGEHGDPDLQLVARIDDVAGAKAQGWMNVYRNHPIGGAKSGLQGGVIYLTREEADAAPGAKNRVDCIEVRVAAQPSVIWRTLHNPWSDRDVDGMPF